jgi:serine phosphatase RsbU (regulator of sigma subunit)/tetratricopeptide (TPR) repeat protein
MERKKIIIIIICCVITKIGFSYNKANVNIDSLLSQIKHDKIDSNKAKNYLIISEFYLGHDDKKALHYAKLGHDLSVKSGYKNGLAKSFFCFGLANVYSSNNKGAIENFKKSYILFEELKNYSQVAAILNNLGILHENESNYTKAIEYYFKSLRINKKIKNYSTMAANLNGIASVYGILGEKTKALQYFKKAYRVNKKTNNLNWQSINLSNIGSIYFEQENLKDALKYFLKAYEINKILKDAYNLALVHTNIASVYTLQKDFDLSYKHYKESIKYNREIENDYELSATFKSFSEMYFDKYNFVASEKEINFQLAKKYLDSALFLANKMNNINILSRIYYQRSKMNAISKNYKQSLEDYKLYSKLKDSIFNTDNKNKFTQITMQHDFDQKEAKIKFEHDKKITENKNKLNLVGLGLIISVMFSVIVFFQRNKIKKEKKIVDEKNVIIEHKNREILDSITYAKRIQSAILPQPKLVKEFLEDSFILYKPKDIVAGDFYWLEVVGDTVLFAAADCTGHGVPGAMVSVVCNNGLNRAVREYGLKEPNEILDKTRQLVVEEFEKSDEEVKDGMDISLCALNTSTNQLFWSGANNPLWILRNGEIMEYKADKQPIGKHFDAKPFSLVEVQLKKNDIIYIFTDGFQDQFGGPKEKKFRVAQMRELFLTLTSKTMEEQRKIIDESFENWKGDLEQVDDVCVIGVRI